jgi:hypothetical protein
MSDRPEPVLNGGKIVAAVTGIITALGTLAVALGYATQSDANSATTAVTAIIGGFVTLVGVSAPLVTARQVREVVTPLASPLDAAGRRLLPEPTPPIVSSGTGHNVTLSKPPPEPKPPAG